jgi:hypothetical protein
VDQVRNLLLGFVDIRLDLLLDLFLDVAFDVFVALIFNVYSCGP